MPAGEEGAFTVDGAIVHMWLLYLLLIIVRIMLLHLYFRIDGYRLTIAELLMVMSSYLVTGPE